MADGWWERLLRFVGFEEIEEIEEPPSELEAERAEEAYAGGYTSRRQRRAATTSGNGRPMDDRRLAGDNVNVRKGSLVSLPASDGRFRLVVVRPLKFDEVEYIAKHIKDRSPVILNLEDIETEEAQKLVTEASELSERRHLRAGRRNAANWQLHPALYAAQCRSIYRGPARGAKGAALTRYRAGRGPGGFASYRQLMLSSRSISG